MLKLRKIAVTGSLASGKSLVCDIFTDLGAYVVRADEIVHHLFVSDEACIQQVEKLMGKEVKINGQIDRNKIATIVGSDKNKLFELEKILHPLVFQQIQTLYRKACEHRKSRDFVVEVPLLFEAGWETFFDTIIVVTADSKLCEERYLEKGFSQADYKWRMARQWPIEEKIKRADFVIHNNGLKKALKEQVEQFLNNN